MKDILVAIACSTGYREDQLDLCLGTQRRFFVGGKGVTGDVLLALPVVRYSRLEGLAAAFWEVEVNNGGKRARRLLVSMTKFLRGASREPALRPEFTQAPGTMAAKTKGLRTDLAETADALAV